MCIYQHAPTRGAGGFYRHRMYLAELVRRDWHVDLISTPVNYMTGAVPEPYTGKLYTREEIEGIVHHWVWAAAHRHRSRRHRIGNYVSFATSALLRGLTLPRPDVVWASSPPLPIGTVGSTIAARFGAPWIFEIRDLWPESAASVGWLARESRVYRGLEHLAHRYASGADAVVVPTPGLVSSAQAHGARHVFLIPGSVIDAPPDPEVRNSVRSELGVPDNICLFLYMGAHGVANGLDLLLDAVKTLRGSQRALFVLAGDGSDRQRLEARVRTEGLDRIRMLGAVAKHRVAELLAASDVCLHVLRPDPLFSGAQPTKILEYFGSHRPFVTTVPGLPERLAVESGGGFASAPGDLAVELERWIQMAPDERQERGERSFRYGSRRFDFEQTVDTLEKLLVAVADRRALAVEGM